MRAPFPYVSYFYKIMWFSRSVEVDWDAMWNNDVISIPFYFRHWEHPVRVRRSERHNPTIQPEGVQPCLSVYIKGPWHKSVIVCKTHNLNIITSRHNVYVNSRTEIGWTNLFQLKMFNEKVRIDCKSFNPNTSVKWATPARWGPAWCDRGPFRAGYDRGPFRAGSGRIASTVKGFLTCFFMMKLFTIYVCVCIGEY